jgi:hypothetical protein
MKLHWSENWKKTITGKGRFFFPLGWSEKESWKDFFPVFFLRMWEIVMTENLERKLTARDCHTMTEFWLLLQLLEMWEELMMQIVLFAGNFGPIIMFWSTPSVRSWWSQWGDMAASHCYSWWKGMVTLTRRAWPTLILVMFILVWSGL